MKENLIKKLALQQKRHYANGRNGGGIPAHILAKQQRKVAE
ncbi:hypothetical protein [Atlantibacter hermannii]|nr:hypothetical protein [Atlantibacter hermannii]